MNTFQFTKKGKKSLRELPKDMQKRIEERLHWLKSHPDIFSVIETLQDYYPATHRVRVGNYRVLVHHESQAKSNNLFYVLKIGHRGGIYRQSI
ncbi:MAG: type II toxin-antitoxin system RelE/ParE family toxin [Candidatus Peregrinibacteria bacterium]|nr:type II toxin-antitoxin system RelE/ParE family toxin [Candidatus Peregrinibacteria bacterium]